VGKGIHGPAPRTQDKAAAHRRGPESPRGDDIGAFTGYGPSPRYRTELGPCSPNCSPQRVAAPNAVDANWSPVTARSARATERSIWTSSVKTAEVPPTRQETTVTGSGRAPATATRRGSRGRPVGGSRCRPLVGGERARPCPPPTVGEVDAGSRSRRSVPLTLMVVDLTSTATATMRPCPPSPTSWPNPATSSSPG
jgi:hypothetical protein